MKLFPSKHSNPDQTVLATAVLILKYLRAEQAVTYDDLYEHCRTESTDPSILFGPATGLLYLLGLVEYLPKADLFEYVGEPA